MKKTCVLFTLSLCLLMGALFALPVSAADGDNLVANGGLELGNTTGWDLHNAALATDVVRSGSYSLKLNSTVAYTSAAHLIVPVRKNATCTVTFWYRYASRPSSGCTYQLYVYKGAGTDAGNYGGREFVRYDNYTTWRQASMTFDVGNFNYINLKFCPGGNGSVACYLDDVVVTTTGGDEVEEAPYLTSFGTKDNRPISAANNLIQNGGFESAANAAWNTANFIKGGMSVVEDATAPEGSKSLYFNSGNTTEKVWHTFPVTVEKYTVYTFSAWVKSPRLSNTNRATATFGVANAKNGEFLIYDKYHGDGYGVSNRSNKELQLTPTSPDDEWHLRSVTFYSGSHSTVYIAVYGASSQMYLDDVALYKSMYGSEYVSPLRTTTLSAANNTGYKYCADEDSLIPASHMSGAAARQHWSANPAWRNGFLSFVDTEDDTHGTALQYTASAYTARGLQYIDWIDVQPNTTYTLTMDIKRLSTGGGRVALLDDNINAPAEFYAVHFTATDSGWVTYSITFNTRVYSRVGFAIVDGGGSAQIDKVRLFRTTDGIADEPADSSIPVLLPKGGKTAVQELSDGGVSVDVIRNGGFESGSWDSWVTYQSTALSGTVGHSGSYGAHLRGDGSWGALIEQYEIPLQAGKTYTFSFWYKALSNGTNVTLIDLATEKMYVTVWANVNTWIKYEQTFVADTTCVVRLNFCGGGNGIAESIYVDDISLIQHAEPELGVAFLMDLEAFGVQRYENYVGNLDNATVDVYGDGEAYRLLRMGCVMTNDAVLGANKKAFTLEQVTGSGGMVLDIPAVYLQNVTTSSASYAVRIINIPYKYRETLIFARPYYVFEQDGQEVVVYGDVYSRSYSHAGGGGEFEIE